MSDVTEKWRSERVTAALYDAGVQHATIARAGAWAMWGTDLRPMFTDIARLARPRGNGSKDLSKTERAHLMAKSASGDQVSVQ